MVWLNGSLCCHRALLLGVFRHHYAYIYYCPFKLHSWRYIHWTNIFSIVTQIQWKIFSAVVHFLAAICCLGHGSSDVLKIIQIEFQWEQIDGLVLERLNSSALAMELCLSCTNQSKCGLCIKFDNCNERESLVKWSPVHQTGRWSCLEADDTIDHHLLMEWIDIQSGCRG